MREIVVISGGSHKGVVKISSVEGRDNRVSVTCRLDFKPNGAHLYLVGDNIAQTTLNDLNTTIEMPFCANSEFGCMLRSPNVTMFGGSMQKAKILKNVDDYLKRDTRLQGVKNRVEQINDSDKNYYKNTVDGNLKKSNYSQQKNSDEIKENCNLDCSQTHGVIIENFNDEITNQSSGDTQSSNEFAIECKGIEIDVESAARIAGVKDVTEWVKYDGDNFYYAVKPQLDELFVCYPKDEELNSHVPSSSWVRVDVEDGYYVVGILYDEQDREPTHICYGVPATSNSRQPKELANLATWLPIDNGRGYWTIFQSAKNGEIVNIK